MLNITIRKVQIKLQWGIISHKSECPASKKVYRHAGNVWKGGNAGKGVGKMELSYTIDGNVNWYNHFEEQFGRSLKN